METGVSNAMLAIDHGWFRWIPRRRRWCQDSNHTGFEWRRGLGLLTRGGLLCFLFTIHQSATTTDQTGKGEGGERSQRFEASMMSVTQSRCGDGLESKGLGKG